MHEILYQHYKIQERAKYILISVEASKGLFINDVIHLGGGGEVVEKMTFTFSADNLSNHTTRDGDDVKIDILSIALFK